MHQLVNRVPYTLCEITIPKTLSKHNSEGIKIGKKLNMLYLKPSFHENNRLKVPLITMPLEFKGRTPRYIFDNFKNLKASEFKVN